MQTIPLGLKLLILGAVSIFCFGLFQACSTMNQKPGASEDPVAISFTVTKPVVVTEEERARFIAAFNKHTDPDCTYLKDPKAGVIWPPKGTKVITAKALAPDKFEPLRSGKLMMIKDVQFMRRLNSLNAVAAINHVQGTPPPQGFVRNVYMPPQFSGAVKNTQFLCFKSEAEMQAFLRAISDR